MARQEFLSGGFKGRLGAVIGQGWKDKMTIRTYTGWTDPQTPAHIENRKIFGQATKLAQEAMNINGGADFWQYGTKTEFNNRVSTARLRLKAGLPPDQALPLYPDHYFDPIKLQGFTANFDENTETITITAPDTKMTDNRTFEVKWYYYDPRNNGFNVDTKNIVVSKNAFLSTSHDWDITYNFPQGSWIEARTIDDASFDNHGFIFERHPIDQPFWPEDGIDASLAQDFWNEGDPSLIFWGNTDGIKRSFSFDAILHYKDSNDGTWKDRVLRLEIIDGVTKAFHIYYDSENMSFPAGSEISWDDTYIPKPDNLWIALGGIHFTDPFNTI
jgi:hypothetical protein